jgi:hypothetical protein
MTTARTRAVPELDHRAKSAAKRLAQDLTAEIGDRHLRARLRTRCYNQAVALLDELNRMHARRDARARQAVLGAGAAGAVLGCLATWVLIG